ncbi:MAG: hypothetical protein KAX30_04485 [Candidatus Atribacteria bacterium]|nr:hypothetical protein [Candidatus Atribacteria bacterium]
MKKSYSFNILGSKKCMDCGERLKKRIEEEHPKFRRCYHCHVISEGLRGHRMAA